jgi:hypothetical protein
MRKSLTYLMAFWCLFGCQEDHIPKQIEPEIFVSSAYITERTNGQIIVNCESINLSSVLKKEFGICWSETPNPTLNNNKQISGENSNNEGPFEEQIRIFKPNTIYYIRAYIIIENKVIYSNDYVFNPNYAEGWSRKEDIDRNNTINTGFTNGGTFTIAVYRKVKGQEKVLITFFNPFGNYWLPETIEEPYLRDPINVKLQYGDNLTDYLTIGGFNLENEFSNKYIFQNLIRSGIYNKLGQLPTDNPNYWVFTAGRELFYLQKNDPKNIWSYNYDTFLWTQRATDSTIPLVNPSGFRIGNKAMILDTQSEDERIYLFDKNTLKFEFLGNKPGIKRKNALAIEVNNKLIYGLGVSNNGKGLKDLWEYDLTAKKWKQLADYPGAGSVNLNAFAINNSLFIGLGYSAFNSAIDTEIYFQAYDFWQYRP